MKLTFGGYDHTEHLEQGSLILRHYGALRSSMKATLLLSASIPHLPAVGEEIQITENDEVLWGGILVESEWECYDQDRARVALRGQGYEQILQRYCFPAISTGEMTPSATAQYLFETYLHPQDGLCLGEIDEGITTKNAYTFYPAKAASVFDFLAGENGYRWWVDREKKFHMKRTLPRAALTLSVDLTEQDENRISDLQTFVFRDSTAGYRNMQYAYNKSGNVDGIARADTEILTMQSRYGSGEYGAATYSSVIYSEQDAQRIAAQVLSESPGTGEVEFTTDDGRFSVGQVIGVCAPICGIRELTNYSVTEIRAVYFYDRFRYTVTARKTDAGALSVPTWEEALAQRNLIEAR